MAVQYDNHKTPCQLQNPIYDSFPIMPTCVSLQDLDRKSMTFSILAHAQILLLTEIHTRDLPYHELCLI